MKKNKLKLLLGKGADKLISILEYANAGTDNLLDGLGEKTTGEGKLIKPSKVLSYFNKGIRLGDLALSQHDSNLHALIFGVSGSGKSSQIFLNNLLSKSHGSMIFRDVDGSFAEKTTGFLHSQGVDVKIINVKQASKSTDGVNVLAGDLSRADMARISQLIISTNFKEKSYWTLSAEEAGTNFLALLKETTAPELHNLFNLKIIVESYIADASALDYLIVKSKDQDTIRAFEALASTPDKSRQSTLTTLKSCLARIDEQIAIVSSISTFNWLDLRKKRTCIFIQSDVLDDEFLNMIQSLIYTDILKSLMSALPKEGDLPVRIFLDECSTLSLGKILESAFLNLRKYSCGLVCAFQSPQSIESAYNRQISEVIQANAFTKLYLKGMDLPTAKFLEEYIGYEEIEDKKGRVKKEPVLSAFAIRTLKKKAVLLTGNNPACLVGLKPYYKIHRMKKRLAFPKPELESLLDKLPNGSELQRVDLSGTELKNRMSTLLNDDEE